jgi:hypothetical protein
VEGVFSVVDRTDLHNDANTTGTGPDDPRRAEAFQRAAEMRFTEVDLKDRISVALTDYMVTRHGGRASGLEHLRNLQSHDKNYMIRTLPPAVEGAVPTGASSRWVTVKESATGRYVEHYAVWQGPGLKDLPVDSKVEVMFSLRDVRTPTVYVDGACRGKLTIEARWRTGGPLTYAALVAAARSKRSGKNKHYPERSAEDVETALEKLERSVAGTAKSQCKSPNAGAALVAELRGDGVAAPEARPSSQMTDGVPSAEEQGSTSSQSASTPRAMPAAASSKPFTNPPAPDLPDDVLRRIHARKIIYLGGDR